MADTVLLPGSREDFVLLARTQKGRLYKKQILHMGKEFVHPANPKKKIKVTEDLVKSLEKNFNDGIGDIVQVPIVDGGNAHTEDPTRNVGEVVGLEHDDKGVYVIIDDRRTDEQIKEQGELGKTLIGASALIHLDYPDTETGTPQGPTLLHTAITNRPYITKLDDFEEVIAASADTLGVDQPVIMSPADNPPDEEQETEMELDELLEELKTKHGIDVAALQEKAAAPDTGELIAAMSSVLTAAGKTVETPPEEDGPTVQNVAEALIELAGEKVELSNQVAELVKAREADQLKAAEKEIDDFIKEGRILPKQRDAMIAMSITDRETFDKLLPDSPIVSLSATGVTVHEAPVSEEFQKEADRLAELAKKL